jgi:ribosomal protein L7/L12
MTAIKDVDEGKGPEHYAMSDEASVRFLRAVKHDYGNDVAVDCMNHLQTTLGKDWAGRVVFNMMADHFKAYENLTLSFDAVANVGKPVGKINCIKSIRALTAMGLGEAKAFVERAMELGPQNAKLELAWQNDPQARHRAIQTEVESIKTAGFKVSVL